MKKYSVLYLSVSSKTNGLTCYTEDGKKVTYPNIRDLCYNRNCVDLSVGGWSYESNGTIIALTEESLCELLGCDRIINEL